RAIGTAALRDIRLLRCVGDAIDQREVREVQRQHSLTGIEMEVNMVRTGAGIAVGKETEVTVAGDEAEVRDLVPIGPAEGFIRKIEAADAHRQWISIIKFKEP